MPKPSRPIPIWLGGSSDAAFERAARLADGFIFIGGDIDRSVDVWQRLRDRVSRAGRSVDDFVGEYVVRPRSGIDGLTADIEAWREVGGTHASVNTMGMGLESLDAHLDLLATIAGGLSLA